MGQYTLLHIVLALHANFQKTFGWLLWPDPAGRLFFFLGRLLSTKKMRPVHFPCRGYLLWYLEQ